MAEAVDKILLIPRFTCFAGAGPFTTPPIYVRPYDLASIVLWTGPGQGATPGTATVVVQESADLTLWSGIGGSLTGAGEVADTYGLRLDWMRLEVTLTGSPACSTLWAVGNFVRRQALA